MTAAFGRPFCCQPIVQSSTLRSTARFIRRKSGSADTSVAPRSSADAAIQRSLSPNPSFDKSKSRRFARSRGPNCARSAAFRLPYRVAMAGVIGTRAIPSRNRSTAARFSSLRCEIEAPYRSSPATMTDVTTRSDVSSPSRASNVESRATMRKQWFVSSRNKESEPTLRARRRNNLDDLVEIITFPAGGVFDEVFRGRPAESHLSRSFRRQAERFCGSGCGFCHGA